MMYNPQAVFFCLKESSVFGRYTKDPPSTLGLLALTGILPGWRDGYDYELVWNGIF